MFFKKNKNANEPSLHIESENLAVPEVHSTKDTGVDITEKEEDRATHTTIDFSGAMPEVHFRK